VRKLTLEYINTIAPEHGRTSCNDEDRANCSYKIRETKLRNVVIRVEFEQAPRCTRCFLLETMREQEIGVPVSEDLQIETDVRITLKQPDFEIRQK
jgi:hypothetical protein